jgi:hypothetical protein
MSGRQEWIRHIPLRRLTGDPTADLVCPVCGAVPYQYCNPRFPDYERERQDTFLLVFESRPADNLPRTHPRLSCNGMVFWMVG